MNRGCAQCKAPIPVKQQGATILCETCESKWWSDIQPFYEFQLKLALDKLPLEATTRGKRKT
jgi:hypothetical protein